MLNRYFHFFALLLVLLPAWGMARQKEFDFNVRCRQAYDEIISLKLDNGKRLLEQEKIIHPDNLIPYFLDNYIDFFSLFFNEDPQEYVAKKNRRGERLALMQQGPSTSPYYLFTRSMIMIQWALVKVKFGEKWDAAWEIRRGYLLAKENTKKYPHFAPNQLIVGCLQTVFGTIPDGYRWLSNILGLNGSITQGMRTLRGFVEDSSAGAQWFRQEAIFYYCYLQFYIENKPEEVFDFIQRRHLDVKNNLLYTFMAVNLSLNNQRAAYGLKVMAERNQSPDYFRFPYLDFEYGILKLYHQEKDAPVYLEKFLNNFKGKFYVKEALSRLSWAYYLQGNTEKAQYYRNLIHSRGNAETDGDKQALKEASTGKWPDPALLKARLLSDGGYFQEALEILQSKSVTDFTGLADKLEYAYRLARIYDEIGEDSKAIPFYETTIKGGAGRPEYFAARAALQLGNIYERQGNKAKAIEYYRRCLNMEEHEYKNSLDQRAKAGIQRLSGN